MTIVGLVACDPPWAGPSFPDGAQSLNLSYVTVRGPIDVGPGVVAAISLAAVRDGVISHAMRVHESEQTVCALNPYDAAADPCWRHMSDQPGYVYIAVITNPECTNPVKEAAALGGHTLYFIHWVGNPQGTCSAALARPSWRLYTAPRRDFPASGTLTVRLELQGTEQGSTDTRMVLS